MRGTIVLLRISLVVYICLLILSLSAARPILAQNAPIAGSDFYGINFVSPTQPWLRVAADSGARVVRWQFNWRDHEPSPGSWDWSKSDDAIAAWTQAGLTIHAILHNPPTYMLAASNGLMPTGLDLQYDSTSPSFSRFCFMFASRYKGQIKSYEVWNEPDLSEFWNGTAQQYYTLLKGCYLGIKVADPAAIVVMAGMAFVQGKGFYADIVHAIASDPTAPANNFFFDVIGIHMYGDPELVYTRTIETRQEFERYGMFKPVWITETNVALRGVNGVPDIPHFLLATPEEAGWYVLQAASNALAAGADRLMFFRLEDGNMDAAWGIVNRDGSPRPAYQALQIATTVLHSAVSVQREVRDGIVITTIHRTDGARIITMYSQSGQSAYVTLPAESPAGVLLGSTGEYHVIDSVNGNYTVILPPARGRDFSRPYAYSVGGPVMILIEQDRDAPVSTVDMQPVPDDKTHIIVHWSADDGIYGTGVANFDVEMNVNHTSWQRLLSAVIDNQYVYDLSAGGSVLFRVRATDRVGNVGEFSQPVEATLNLMGTLVAQVVDLRNQPVPLARVELGDGTLHDADASGQVQIALAPGTVEIKHVDGAGQGEAFPPPVEIKLSEQTSVTWILLPRQNLVANGDFEHSLRDWKITSPEDSARLRSDDSTQGTVLQINGARRPWGSPGVRMEISIPAGITAPLLSFTYNLLEKGQSLRLRIVSGNQQMIGWQADSATSSFTRTWVDLRPYSGKQITLVWELYGPKGGNPGVAQIDDIVIGDVPVLP
jgi:hypothetical protein